VPGAGFPLPATHHCEFPVAVKAGVGISAADRDAGVSVDTIIRVSSCRATERPSRTLRPSLRSPAAAGRALGRSGAVHRANIAFVTTFPPPVEAPQVFDHHGGEVDVHPPAVVGALQTPLFSLVFQGSGCTASHGPTGDRVWVDYFHVHCKVPPPVPRLQQDVGWAASVSGDVHLEIMRNSGLGQDLAQKGTM